MTDPGLEQIIPAVEQSANASSLFNRRANATAAVDMSHHQLSPQRLLPLLVVSIFIAEICVMFLLAALPTLSVMLEALVDSTVLLVMLAPTVYFFHYRPLLHHYNARKRIIEQLTASEERLALALEAVNDGLGDWDLESNQVYFSPRVHAMLGYELGEFKSNLSDWLQLIHPDDSASRDLALEEHLANKSNRYEVEYRLKNKIGDWIWVLARGKVVKRDNNGRALRMVGTYTDITKRKVVEEALRSSEVEIRALTQRLLSMAEDEKKHLAQDLHDEFGQVLTAFQFGVEMLREHSFEDQEDYQAQCTRLLKLVARMETDLRHICDHLRPIMLDDVGLIATLQWHISEFRLLDRSLQVEFQVQGDERPLLRDIHIVLYRIFQEALNNVVKHAQADRVQIDVIYQADKVFLIVCDDGCGIDKTNHSPALRQGAALGLLGMKERAAAVNGRIRIESGVNQGTTVQVEIPLKGEFYASD